ncbi:hypothetical protein ACJMK2_006035 [Sinanodonta woodiana]|uniref:Transglutaminase-like domain-containing protein n=1 Tax=Sinanodonta woodiana TaxID=1069815 RepID=A0ABD3VRW9_SINWO
MEAPNTFYPANILKTNRGIPPPIRLGYTKAEAYGDLSQLRSVDQHALEVANANHETFKDLLWHLVYSRSLFSDLEKARVIFKWMTTKDLNTIRFNTCKEETAEAEFVALQNKETTYAKIYALMCGYAGLYCVVLTGYAKGRNFHPGDSFNGDSNHSWNAVYIDDNWHFVDTKWAAMGGGRNNNKKDITREDFYFLTDPDQFIYSHWPHQQEWQFLNRQISLSEFEELPFVKPHFFKCNIHLGWTKMPIIYANHGIASWNIKTSKPIRLGCKIVSVNGPVNVKKDVDLRTLILQESRPDETKFSFRAPKAGTYIFKIFAKLLDSDDTTSTLKEIVEYKLVAKEPAEDAMPLPPCAHNIWGPGSRARKLGLDPVRRSGVLATYDHDFKLKFQKLKSLSVICRLRRYELPDTILERCISVTNADTVTVHLNLPEVGEYGVDVYVSDKKDGRRFVHACQYLVLYLSNDEDMTPFFRQFCDGQIIDDGCTGGEELKKAENDTRTVWNIPHIDPEELPELRIDEHVISKPPPSFEMTPTSYSDELSPAPAPDAGFDSVYEFIDRRTIESLDAHAEMVANNNHDNFRELMWDLIYSTKIKNDLAKLRLIFRWITSKKVEDITFKAVEPESPEEVLIWLKDGRSTHAHVVYTMCCFAGIHSRVIQGIAKGANHQIGKELSSEENQHWWNAVYLYGRWCLLDSYLANIPLVNKTSSGDFKYSFNESYFLVDPNKFIYSHFPNEQSWQLLSHPVSMEEFQMQPKATPHFLMFGLQFLSHKAGILYTHDETEIQLTFPAKRSGLKFVFSLIMNSGIDEYNGVKLNQFGLVDCTSNVAYFKISLPDKGLYSLNIFAKEDTPMAKDMSFSLVCEYLLHQETTPLVPPVPFPLCSSLMWGPGPGFYQLGLTPGNSRGVVYTKNGKADIRIKMMKPMQLRYQVKLSPGWNDAASPMVLYKIIENSAIFTVIPKRSGRYGLEIYARDPDTQEKDDMRFRQIAQYLVECNEKVEDNNFPSLSPGFLGPQPKFIEFGLKTLNHHDPLIELKDFNHVEIQLGTSIDMKFNIQLVEVETARDLSDYVFIQTQPSIVTFLVNIPCLGFFKLQIHGNTFRDASSTSLGLFNYLIFCKGDIEPVYPYPRQLGHWKEGCFMFEPLILHRKTNEPEVKFRVHVPKAKKVVIFVEQNVQELISRGPVQWEGVINLEKYYGTDTKVILAANYGGDDERFATLLEYRV